MIIENSFDVDADPDRVFDFLQNPHNVATCFPGAELTEDLGDDQYKGKVKIKLGPVTAAFSGIARITEKDEAEHLAVLVAEGKDARGSGTAKATATMKVEPTETGSRVLLRTDLTISGKLAQFGRGIMADVSGRMVGDLAVRVRERIESEGETAPAADTTAAGTPAAATSPAPAPAAEAAPAEGAAASGSAGTAPTQGTPAPVAESETADPVALSGATTEPATATVPPEAGSESTTEAPATTPAGTSPVATAPAPPAKAPAPSSEPAGAIKASTLLKVMIAGVFRRLFARLRGRSKDTEAR